MRAPLTALLAACSTAAPPPLPTTLPSVRVQTLGGEAGDVRVAAAGRPMVLDFFATWCEPCRESFPRLARLAKDHPEVAVLGVDIGEEPGLVSSFVARVGIGYAVFVDADLRLADAAGVARIPAVLVVAADGTIVWRGSGVDAALEAAVVRVAGTAAVR
jgi:thiol-disulfide isomerase/thioredoxin